ncbi:MAG: hypothetical protein VKP62_09690 [Candidatus Sericytochromatia bacterium]|nr:hypothetical protein [Candidatus Sericytochromatia bacterium]
MGTPLSTSSNQQDFLASAQNLAKVQGEINTEMQNIGNQISKGTDQATLMKLQVQLEDLKRRADSLKELREQLREAQKAANTVR